MKRLPAVFALALVTLGSSAHAANRVQYASLDVHNALMAPDEAKFASVDVQKILDLSYAGKEAKAKLESAALKAEMEKNSREKELNKLNAELEQQSALLSETERSAKQKSYDRKLMEYRQFVTRSTDELRAENAELTRSLLGKIFKLVQEYGRKKGFVCIFVKNENMLYLDHKLDITEAVLHDFNAM